VACFTATGGVDEAVLAVAGRLAAARGQRAG
jgi:hypothetical protein